MRYHSLYESTPEVMFPKISQDLKRSPVLALFMVGLLCLFAAVYLTSSEPWLRRHGLLIGWDFSMFWSAGTLASDGPAIDIYHPEKFHELKEDLFGHVPEQNWPYPPQMLFLVVPFGHLPYIPSLVAWWLATLGAYLLASGRFVLLVAPATVANLILGQTGALVGALYLAALRTLRSRPVVSGVLIGLLTIKPHLGLMIPVALLSLRAWRVMGAAVLTTLTVVAASSLVFGWEVWFAWLGPLLGQVSLLENYIWTMMPSTFMGARSLGLSTWAAWLTQMPFTLFAIGSTWWAFSRLRRRLIRETTAFSILLLSACIATPYISNYDLTLVSPVVLSALSDRPHTAALLWFCDRLVWVFISVLPLLMLFWSLVLPPVGCVVLAWALSWMIRRAVREGRARHGCSL